MHGLPVGAGAVERPDADHEGEVAQLEHARDREVERAVQRDEAVQGLADGGAAGREAAGLGGEGGVALVERHRGLEIPGVDSGDDRCEHLLRRSGADRRT
jgi:hypothetical protein